MFGAVIISVAAFLAPLSLNTFDNQSACDIVLTTVDGVMVVEAFVISEGWEGARFVMDARTMHGTSVSNSVQSGTIPDATELSLPVSLARIRTVAPKGAITEVSLVLSLADKTSECRERIIR